MTDQSTTDQTITVLDRDGQSHRIEWEPEQSLMEALRDNDLPVLASCGGTASCATCHVYVEEDVFEAAGERSEDEMELLTEAEGYRETASRLSCQVPYRQQFLGSTVTLAPEDE